MGDGGRTDLAHDPAGPAAVAGKKRPRNGSDDGADLKRVAEIVMVISAIGEMRGGRGPTAAEKAMVAEARELLAGMCRELKPRDLFSRDAVRVVVEDLGLNRSGDPIPGCRPPKISIADKLLLTKKRMEEPKEFATLHSPQPLPVGFGVNSESHGSVFLGAPRFLPDRPTPMAVSAGGFQNSSPEVRGPDPASATTFLKQSHGNEIQPSATLTTTSTSPLVKDSPSLSLPHTEAAHFRWNARSTGPAHLKQVRAEYAPAKTPSTLVKSTSSATVKPDQENKLLGHTLVKFEGVHEDNAFQSSYQEIGSQVTHTSVIQATPGNLLIGNQPFQNLTYAHETSYFTNHNDIAEGVQRVLQQKNSGHPNWTLPLIDYMNKPLSCQICKIIINDVESMLVCDACEKGTHLKCLQSYANTGIPKSMWYCPKCVIASNGKTYPPKYGPVVKSVAISKVSSNTAGTHASPDIRAENSESLVNKKSVSNGYLGLPYPVNASNMLSSHSELASNSKATSAREMQGVDLLSAGMKREDGMHIDIGTSTCPSQERDLMLCAFSGTQSKSSGKQVESRELSSFDKQRLTHESLSGSNIVSNQICSNYHNETSEAAHPLQVLSHPQICNRMEVLASDEVSANQLHEVTEPNADELKPCKLGGILKYEDDRDIRPDNQVNSESNGASDSGGTTVDCGRILPLDSHTVDWVGDALETVEGKTYYQSCCINGALHQLQDHVLVSSNSQNLFPSKLQSLWEDTKTGLKWSIVDTYYFPWDLSEVVNRPSTPENSEIYASNNRSTKTASLIHGPCEVLPIDKFREESDKRTQLGDTNNDPRPIFMCRWLYDESKGIFQSVTD